MKGILIKIKEGHVIDGEGEGLGKDKEGNDHTFWRSSGHLEVPVDLAIKLELERPQRYEMVDRKLAKSLAATKEEDELEEEEPVEEEVAEKLVEEEITLKDLKAKTKDELNDWAAKRGYEVNPGRQRKGKMIKELVKQIELKTGKKVK